METNTKIIMYKDKPCIKAKVVMLPTKEKTNIIKHNIGVLYKYKEPVLATHGYTNQHLYIVSDEKPKINDWTLISLGGNYSLSQLKEKESGGFKIIVTTDSSLKYTNHRISPVTNFCDFPQPSQAFVEAYCKAGGINEVLVELEPFKGVCNCLHRNLDDSVDLMFAKCINEFNTCTKSEKIIKTDSHNTISIHPVEEKMYSKEEVKKLLELGMNKAKSNFNSGEISSWIKENLN